MLKIKCRKKKRSPDYTEEQISTVKSNCRWMVKNYRKKSFLLDDEKYFTLSAPQMPGNDIYYAADPSTTPPQVKYKFKKKFESKVMLYIVVSNKGVSSPYFLKSGLAVNQNVYQNQCLAKYLLPFINKHHKNDDYIFWPDKASSHYAKKTVEYLESKNVPFVPKDRNPTNLPQCRPIEDFFGELAQAVYRGGWRAKTIPQLKNRIKYCLRKMDTKGVQRACDKIPTKLRHVADHGPFSKIH
jgi:hypothetical protein